MNFDPANHGLDILSSRVGIEAFPKLVAEIKDVENSANKEKDTIQTMSEVTARYQDLLIEVVFSETLKLTIAKGFDELYSIIDSDVLVVKSLQALPGLSKFQKSFSELLNKLELARMVLNQLQTIQDTILSTHKLFESEEVRVQLSVEVRRFKLIEAAYRSIIANAEKMQSLAAIIEKAPDLPSSLNDMQNGLKIIIQNIQGWLDNKRNNFPRLFFISDEELLDLVSVAKKPNVVARYISK
jgi:dynein heavy chain